MRRNIMIGLGLLSAFGMGLCFGVHLERNSSIVSESLYSKSDSDSPQLIDYARANEKVAAILNDGNFDNRSHIYYVPGAGGSKIVQIDHERRFRLWRFEKKSRLDDLALSAAP